MKIKSNFVCKCKNISKYVLEEKLKFREIFYVKNFILKCEISSAGAAIL